MSIKQHVFLFDCNYCKFSIPTVIICRRWILSNMAIFGYPFVKKIGPPRKLTWQWKIHHEWRCISYWKWWFSNVMLVFMGCKYLVGLFVFLSGASSELWQDQSLSRQMRSLSPWITKQKMTQKLNEITTRWFKSWPFHPLLGGHLITISKGHLTIPKRAQRAFKNQTQSPHEQCSRGHPGWLDYIGDAQLPNYMGIIFLAVFLGSL